MKSCVIIENGWILIGDTKEAATNALHLADASVVRKWNNGRGIGGIAKAEYKDEYTLDYIGDVEIYQSKVLFVIPCEW